MFEKAFRAARRKCNSLTTNDTSMAAHVGNLVPFAVASAISRLFSTSTYSDIRIAFSISWKKGAPAADSNDIMAKLIIMWQKDELVCLINGKRKALAVYWRSGNVETQRLKGSGRRRSTVVQKSLKSSAFIFLVLKSFVCFFIFLSSLIV